MKSFLSSFLLRTASKLTTCRPWRDLGLAGSVLRDTRGLSTRRLSSLCRNSLGKSEFVRKCSRGTCSGRAWCFARKVDYLLIRSSVGALSNFILSTLVRVVPWRRQTSRLASLVATTSLAILGGVFIWQHQVIIFRWASALWAWICNWIDLSALIECDSWCNHSLLADLRPDSSFGRIGASRRLLFTFSLRMNYLTIFTICLL